MNRTSARTALVLLTALNFLNYVDRYVLPAVQVPIENELHISNLQFGYLFSSFFIFYAIAALPIGMLADRYPRRAIIAAGGIVWSSATLLTAFTKDYESLFIRHLIVGVGEASFATIAPAFLADLYSDRQRGRVLAIFNTALPVGMAVGTILGGALGSRYGWRTPFYVGALPGFVISLLIFLVPEPQRGAQDVADHRADKRQVLSLFKNGAFLTACLGMAMLTFSESGLQTFVIKFLVAVRGIGQGTATAVFGGMSAFNGIVPVVFGGWLADRLLRRHHTANYSLSATCMAAAIPFMIVAIYVPGPTMWPAMFMTEMVLFVNTGPLNAAIVNSVAAPIRATALAVNIFLIHFLGDVPAPVIMGKVADKFGMTTAFAAAIAATGLSSLILFYGMRYAPANAHAERGTIHAD